MRSLCHRPPRDRNLVSRHDISHSDVLNNFRCCPALPIGRSVDRKTGFLFDGKNDPANCFRAMSSLGGC
jgi:hypothetical protein